MQKPVATVLPWVLAAALALPAVATPSVRALAQATPPAPAAQKPANNATAPKIDLSTEDRQIVKTIIVDEMKIAPPPSVKLPTTVGALVPEGIVLQPIPVEVSAKIPALLPMSFLVQDNAVLIVDPKSNRIADRIE